MTIAEVIANDEPSQEEMCWLISRYIEERKGVDFQFAPLPHQMVEFVKCFVVARNWFTKTKTHE